MNGEKGVRVWNPGEENRSEQAGIGRVHHLGDPIFFTAGGLGHNRELLGVVCQEFLPACKNPFMRQLVCPDCVKQGGGVRVNHADEECGFTMRKCWIAASVPKGHGIKTIIEGQPDKFEPLDHLLCDVCGAIIADVCLAVTIIPPHRRIARWEHKYGIEITEEQVKFIQQLKGESNGK